MEDLKGLLSDIDAIYMDDNVGDKFNAIKKNKDKFNKFDIYDSKGFIDIFKKNGSDFLKEINDYVSEEVLYNKIEGYRKKCNCKIPELQAQELLKLASLLEDFNSKQNGNIQEIPDTYIIDSIFEIKTNINQIKSRFELIKKYIENNGICFDCPYKFLHIYKFLRIITKDNQYKLLTIDDIEGAIKVIEDFDINICKKTFKTQPNEILNIKPNEILNIKPNEILNIKPNEVLNIKPNETFKTQPNEIPKTQPNEKRFFIPLVIAVIVIAVILLFLYIFKSNTQKKSK